MAISSALSLARQLDFVSTAIETGQAFTDSNTALDVTASLAQIAGCTAVGGLVTAAGRFTDPLIRLGAAISGNRDALAAKGWLSGYIAAEALSKAIDKFNSQNPGSELYDLLHPKPSCAATRPWVKTVTYVGTDNCGKELRTTYAPAPTSPGSADPLILDLNGNGIDAVGINNANPILFDHNASGIKQGTGWIAPTDGFLVLDRNGNGQIDNGSELFGNSTAIYDAAGNVTGTAADGYAALAAQDTNLDGVVNSLDANFASLQVWQDFNQDGIAQAGELTSLAQQGIASLNVAGTAVPQHVNGLILPANTIDSSLPGGNVLAFSGTYTRTDGILLVARDTSQSTVVQA